MRFSKAVILMVGLQASVLMAQEAELVARPADSPDYWIEKSQRLMEGAERMSKPSWLRDKPSEADLRSAEKLAARAEIVREKLASGSSVKEAVDSYKEPNKVTRIEKKPVGSPVVGLDKEARSFIFVSQSMPEIEMKSALEESTESGSVLVFKGIKPGQAIDHVSRMIGEILVKNKNLKPSVVINPSLFIQYDVSSVPTTVVHFNGKMIKASGTMSIDYLLGELEENKDGNLGVVGPTRDVIEPDMIEELKRRTALVDWEEAKKGAADRFWTQSWPDQSLPVATKDDSFLVDPTFTLKKNIEANGKVLAFAGSKYNAQKIMPMTQKIVIFDGTDDQQIGAVKKYLEKSKWPMTSVVLIISNIDRPRGFKALEELQDKFNSRRIFVMEKGMKERFKLKVVPSVVYGSGDYYKVEEIGIKQAVTQ